MAFNPNTRERPSRWASRPQEPIVHINEPLPPKEEGVVKIPAHKPIDVTAIFAPRRIGSFTVNFELDGDIIKPKESDGFLAVKPRGKGTIIKHFVLSSASAIPGKKEVIRSMTEYYSRSKEYRLSQLHYKPRQD